MNGDWLSTLKTRVTERLDESRIRLAKPSALMSLSLLGLVTGVLAAGIQRVYGVLTPELVEGAYRQKTAVNSNPSDL